MPTSDEDEGSLLAVDPAAKRPAGDRASGGVEGTPSGEKRGSGRPRNTVPALETVEFVARSENRLRTLQVLAERPETRRELQDEVGASRGTLRRILLDFEERGWIQGDGRTYQASPLGRMVVGEFVDLLDTMTAVDELGPVMPWFPAEELGLELTWLSDAEVVTPGTGDPYAPLRRLTDAVLTGDRVSVVTDQVTGWCDERVAARVVDGTVSLDVVLGDEALAALRRDSAMAALAVRLAGTGTATTVLADGDVPEIALVDDRAWIVVTDDWGDTRGVVASADERVATRIGMAVDRHRSRGRKLEPEHLEHRANAGDDAAR